MEKYFMIFRALSASVFVFSEFTPPLVKRVITGNFFR